MMRAGQNDSLAEARARHLALQTLGGDYDLLLACRELSGLEGQLPGVPRDTMSVFAGVASEIDDLPVGSERSYWAEDALKKKDAEAQEYRNRVSEVVINALQELLVAIGDTQVPPNDVEV